MFPKLLLMLIAACTARAEFLRIEVYMKDMNCASCSDSLEQRFKKMAGVKSVEVSMDKGTVSLELEKENRIPIERVWDTIKRIGFTPGDSKAVLRGSVLGNVLKISGLDQTLQLEGHAPDGENVELKGTITPPPDPRTPLKLRVD